MEPTIDKSGWVRPESMHVLGFAILCLLFTLGGLAVWRHRRRFMHGPMATVLFLIAICYGFAVGLWVVDAIGIYEPYASETPVKGQSVTGTTTKRPFPTERPLLTEPSLPRR
ncbi:MAG: hypothetical protein WBA63_13145 [Thermomicrobiales bacterium]